MTQRKRPDYFSHEVVKEVTRLIAIGLRTLPDFESAGEELEQDVLEAITHCHSYDAFHICRYLDSIGWICDFQLVDIIHCYGTERLASVMNKIARQWVEENNLTPKFKVDDKVSFVKALNFPQQKGVIVKIREDRLQYHILSDGTDHKVTYVIPEENIISKLES
jgi:hypothetical protein